MKKMLLMLLAMSMLVGCSAGPQSSKAEMVTIIMTAPLFGEQTIEEYVAELEDPTAKVYDAEHYTIEITEEKRIEVLGAFYEDALAQLQEVAGADAVITASEDFRSIDVTGEIASLISFKITAALMADSAQAYALVNPSDRSCEITLNGEKIK